MNLSKNSYLHDSLSAQGRVEQVLSDGNTYSTAIAEYITEAFVALDRAWCVAYINHQATPLLQRTREELLGRNFWEAFPEIVDSVLYHRCLEAASTGVSACIEVETLDQQKWFRVHILPSTEGIGMLLTDITRQKQAEEQLLFQANILRNIRNSVIVTDFQGKITYWNEGADSIFGYSAEEMLGQSITMLNPDLTPAQLAQDLQDIINGQDYAGTWQGRRKDGTVVWVDVRTTLLRDVEGRVCAFVGVAKDITECKRLEEELRRSKEQLEIILKNVADGIIVQDGTGKIIYVNQAVAKAAGYTTVEEMLAAPLFTYWERFEITDEQGQPFLPSHFPGQRTLQEGKTTQLSIRGVDKQTHEVRWSLITSTAVFGADHTPILVVSVLQDITQFKELEQRKDDFVLHVSHELRTPLTALSGFLELLKDHHEKIDAPTQNLFFNQALENCQELTNLVNVVLDAFHVKQKVAPVRPEKLLLAPCVREVLQQLDSRAVQEFTLQVDIPEQLAIWADKQSFHLVLRNLLSNAFKYAPKQTVVAISAVLEERPVQKAPKSGLSPRVCISVQDAGPGIPSDEQRQLFEQFSRLKRDLASTVRGTGLGLYISRQLVEQMGGRIWVESSGRAGEGSRFCFTLPCPPSPVDPVV